MIKRNDLSTSITIEELNRNSFHSVIPFLSICHLHSSATEQLLMPAINSARMNQKWKCEQDCMITGKTEKHISKITDQSGGIFMQPIIKTANIIRRINYANHIPNRFSFPTMFD
ncbi:unnamed protein product [Brugia pahangi]|uniref:Uncharacterized protein n=1 Tax=Brugia pahangi TaxID=6280 RepID=A0A0N4TG18_BRUPA|nr:unnamed protein product [Brugia pahangi]